MRTNVFCSALLISSLISGLAVSSMGQTPPKPAAEPAITIPLCAGTAINASLESTLDSLRSKPGDTVTAVVAESLEYQRSILLPKGSRIIGHVVRTGTDAEQGSAIFVEFDRAILPNGQEAQLNAGIQAFAPPTTPATIPSRKDYEEDWIAGNLPAVNEPVAKSGSSTMVKPSTYTTPRRSVTPDLPPQRTEGGIDRQGRFTPDSKGAFNDPNMRVFTPVSEGSHGTVLIGAKKSVRLEAGTHLLIVIQPPSVGGSAAGGSASADVQ
jgi:hypothetical protein